MTRPPLPLLAALLAAIAALLGWRRRSRVALLDAPGPAGGVRTDDGLRLHVEEDGDPDAPVTVVFSHGFTAQLEEFLLQRETLRTRARLVFYDQRGHGRSPLGAPENATMEQLGRDLAAVIAQRVPRGPVVLVGHSMGGMTLMTFARQHPDVVRDRVAGAFLLATSAGELVTSGLVGAVVRIGHAAAPRAGVAARPAADGPAARAQPPARHEARHVLLRPLPVRLRRRRARAGPPRPGPARGLPDDHDAPPSTRPSSPTTRSTACRCSRRSRPPCSWATATGSPPRRTAGGWRPTSDRTAGWSWCPAPATA